MITDLTFKELAEKWGVGARRVHQLNDQDRIPGSYYKGGIWWAPKNTVDPRWPQGAAGHEANRKRGPK